MTPCAVVVVSFNTRDVLRACLASVIAAGARDVVVADNGSVDGTIEMVAREFPAVRVHVDASNPGYGAAANAGIGLTHAEYVLLLNSDTILQPDAIDALAGYLDEHPRAAIVGPRLLNADGTLQRSCHQFPTPLVTLLDYSWIGQVVGRVPVLRIIYVAASFPHDRARRIDWVTGAALAIRRRAFDEVGGFDPAFFMYYEEVDLSYRLEKARWETHFAPVTDVVHLGGTSTAVQRDAMYAQQLLSGVQYYQRHHPASAGKGAAAFQFAIYSNLLGGAAMLVFAGSAAQRQRVIEKIKAWRRLLPRLRVTVKS